MLKPIDNVIRIPLKPVPVKKHSKWRVFRNISRAWLAAGILLVVLIGVLLFTHPWNKSETAKEQMNRVVAEVSQHMLLPTNEEPTLASVTNRESVKDQTFFKNAENNDQVLLYEKAQLAILYRPSIDKIVNVGPLYANNAGSPYVTSRIAILNGSGDIAKTNTQVSSVLAAFPNAHITSKDQASRNFPTTIIVDVSGKQNALAQQIADSLHIQVGILPLGITAPDADFLLIIGAE